MRRLSDSPRRAAPIGVTTHVWAMVAGQLSIS